MDLRSAVVPTVHTALAGCLGVLAVLGLFATDAAGRDIRVVGDAAFTWLLVLPMAGSVMVGLFDWQMGRGALILRSADVAVFVLAVVELSLGTSGFARWLAGAIALLAASGIAGSLLVARPKRAGFRR